MPVNQKRRNKGFSLIELLIVVAIILIIMAIAIPNLLHSKMTANEASAIGSLTTINTTCITYSTIYGGYPPALASLGPGNPATANSSDLIDSVLASGTRSGYIFAYSPGATDANGHVLTYSLTGQPQSVGSTGQRYFYTDQSGVIRSDPTGVATAASTPIS